MNIILREEIKRIDSYNHNDIHTYSLHEYDSKGNEIKTYFVF